MPAYFLRIVPVNYPLVSFLFKLMASVVLVGDYVARVMVFASVVSAV